MKWKQHTPEQIVDILAEVRELIARGHSVATAVAEVGVSPATYFRWRAEYASLSKTQLGVLKQLQRENERLRRALLEFDTARAPA